MPALLFEWSYHCCLMRQWNPNSALEAQEKNANNVLLSRQRQLWQRWILDVESAISKASQLWYTVVVCNWGIRLGCRRAVASSGRCKKRIRRSLAYTETVDVVQPEGFVFQSNSLRPSAQARITFYQFRASVYDNQKSCRPSFSSASTRSNKAQLLYERAVLDQIGSNKTAASPQSRCSPRTSFC